MKKTSLFVAAACGAISFLNSATAVNAADSAKPNILFILTDDQGYGDISAHGNPVLKTPNLDKLHGEGVRFTDFHVSPTCSPTRSAPTPTPCANRCSCTKCTSRRGCAVSTIDC